MGTFTSDVMDSMSAHSMMQARSAPSTARLIGEWWYARWNDTVASAIKRDAHAGERDLEFFKTRHYDRMLQMRAAHLSWSVIKEWRLDNPFLDDKQWQRKFDVRVARKFAMVKRGALKGRNRGHKEKQHDY